MKKILLALTIAGASLLSFSSCTKEYITEEYVATARTFIYERVASDWKGTDNKAFLPLSIPELTKYYINQGVVSVAYSDDNELTYNSIGTQNGQAFTYEYGVGSVTIKAEDPTLEDFFIEVPEKIFIKITLIDADFVE